MNQEWLQKNRKKIICGILLLFTLIIIWAVIDNISRIGKIPVVVSVFPGDAKTIINNQSYGNGTHWLTPGVYKLTSDKEGFETVRETVVISKMKSQNVIAISLAPQSSDAKEWASKRVEELRNNEMYGSIEAISNREYVKQSNPIVAKLPYIDPYFKIRYVMNDDLSITLIIHTPSPRYRFYAVEKIRDLGYDPVDFIIQFKDFNNPLGEMRESL